MLILLTELPLNCSGIGPSYRGSAFVLLPALQETVMPKKTGEISSIDNCSMGQSYLHAAKAQKSLFMIPSAFSELQKIPNNATVLCPFDC